jgi:hypothetical protein
MAGAGGFGTREVQVYHNGVLTASYDDSFTGFVGESVNLLVRHERRNIDEVTWSGFTAKFEVVSPSHAGLATNDVEDSFAAEALLSEAGVKLRMV